MTARFAAELEAQAEKMGLQQVTFRGRLSASETRALMKQAALLIVPSVWFETFSLNIAEAFACGTPVLCSARGHARKRCGSTHRAFISPPVTPRISLKKSNGPGGIPERWPRWGKKRAANTNCVTRRKEIIRC